VISIQIYKNCGGDICTLNNNMVLYIRVKFKKILIAVSCGGAAIGLTNEVRLGNKKESRTFFINMSYADDPDYVCDV
jgi:hypothetical protein